jgi:hypothetical protein
MEQTAQNLQELNPPLYIFLETCLNDKGIKDIPEALKNDMINDLSERLQQWLIQSVFTHISSSAAVELEKLMETGASQEEVMLFLQNNVPNIGKIFEQEMSKFKQAYLGK